MSLLLFLQEITARLAKVLSSDAALQHGKSILSKLCRKKSTMDTPCPTHYMAS